MKPKIKYKSKKQICTNHNTWNGRVRKIVNDTVLQIERISNSALEKLDQEARLILMEFFNGSPVPILAKKHNLTEEQIRLLVRKSKAAWIEELRRQVSIKQ